MSLYGFGQLLFADLVELKLAWCYLFGATPKSNWMEMGKLLTYFFIILINIVVSLSSSNYLFLAVVLLSTLRTDIISSSRPQYKACGEYPHTHRCVILLCANINPQPLKHQTLFELNFCNAVVITTDCILFQGFYN